MFSLFSTGILLFAAISTLVTISPTTALNSNFGHDNDNNIIEEVNMWHKPEKSGKRTLEKDLDYQVHAISKKTLKNKTINDDRNYVMVDGEKILLPRKLPKFSWKEKEAILLANGLNKTEIAQHRHKKRQRISRKTVSKKRRSLTDPVWRRERIVGPTRSPKGPPVSADLQYCPAKIDAVTQAHNQRTYVFSNEYVHQIYRDRDGLQQKSAFLITDMFDHGPRSVSAAFTNLKSAVTVLIDQNTVYRYRWNKKIQRFYLARKSPQKLDRNITFTPRLAFQWSDGNMIISDGTYFSTYDPYWNVATFTGHTSDYFPGLPRNAIGLVHTSEETYLWLNERANVLVYNMKKFRIVQEYPLRISDYIACLSKRKL